MIRASKHTNKFSNKEKKALLNSFILEYRRIASIYIDYLWYNSYKWTDKDGNRKEFNVQENKLEHPKFIDKKVNEELNLETTLYARALKCCITQVCGMIGAAIEKQRKRLYMLNQIREEGKEPSKQFLKKIEQNIPRKPKAENINPELNSICCDFQEIKSNSFDGFLQLKCIGKILGNIRIPVKYTRNSNKWKSKGKLKKSFLIMNNCIYLRWEVEDKKKKKRGKIVGADQGKKTVVSFSDSQTTPKTNSHGYSLDDIIDILSRKKKGSKAFQKAQVHREDFINWSINQLNFKGIKEIRLEKIWNIGYKTNSGRKMSHWTNTLIRDKVGSRTEEEGVLLNLQSSVYRSQRCSDCGWVRKRNRKGKSFACEKCGHIDDSDINAAKNHE